LVFVEGGFGEGREGERKRVIRESEGKRSESGEAGKTGERKFSFSIYNF